MAFTEQEAFCIAELKADIKANYEAFDSAAYRDVPMLQEIAGIVSQYTAVDDREDVLALLGYLAENYRNMERHTIAAGYYLQYITLACELLQERADEKQLDELRRAVFAAAEERNSYYGVQDACEDLLQMTAPLLGEANTAELIEKGAANPHIKADASEASESYLEVIDAVEREIDEELGTDIYLGRCRMAWSIKREMLEELGIEWRSPAQLYPHILFD